MRQKQMRYGTILLGLAMCAGAETTPSTGASAPQRSGAANSFSDLRSWHGARSPELTVDLIDVEGGQATLFIAPGGESLLVDTGWPGNNGRDAERIAALARRSGLSRIDTVLLTHYHTDHAGGVPSLADRIPIGRFLDHGPQRETGDPATDAAYNGYQQTLRKGSYAHQTVKPGDHLSLGGQVAIEVVSADGDVLQGRADGVRADIPNPACATSPQKPVENSENDRSVGILLTFGKLRVLDLGDLTWGRERDLVCPANKLGPINLYIVSHHGSARSGSPALLAAIRPRLAVMDNGASKGDDASAWETIHAQAGGGQTGGAQTGVGRMLDLWQLHTGEGAGARNVQAERIVNLPGPDHGFALELRGGLDGGLYARSDRTAQTVTYAPPGATHPISGMESPAGRP